MKQQWKRFHFLKGCFSSYDNENQEHTFFLLEVLDCVPWELIKFDN